VNPAVQTPATAALHALRERAGKDPNLRVIFGSPPIAPPSKFNEDFAGRIDFADESTGGIWPAVEQRRTSSSAIVAVVAHLGHLGTTYEAIRAEVARSGSNLKLVAMDGGVVGPPAPASAPVLEDLGLMSTLPGMTVAAPADAESAAAALGACLDHEGPAYLRLASTERRALGHPEFQLGKAPALRTGDDLTVVAVGCLVARAVEVADEIGQMGLHVRVLDAASVKPLDAKAILRAARETEAIVVLEDHTAMAGVGSQAAAIVAEHRPAPVLRLGVPDLFAGPFPTMAQADPYGLSHERVVEACLDLLRRRGKV
jgi:transketolase